MPIPPREAPPPTLEERRKAAAHLLQRHDGDLRRTARRLSICAADAEDAFQRALEIVLLKAPTVAQPDLLRWTVTVVKHEALAVRRRRERVLSANDASALPSEGDEDPLDLFVSDGVGPEERAERAERVSRGCEALGLLKPQEVRALTLKAQGYSYAEIGELTGWSFTKINRCMSEGRKRFLETFSRIEAGDLCDRLAGDLSAFADGELDPQRAPALRLHLRSCAQCRVTLREARGLPARTLALLPLPVAGPWWQRLHEAVAAAISERSVELGVRANQLLEPVLAKKTAVAAVAASAAIAGGGAAAVRIPEERAEHRTETARVAVATPPDRPSPPKPGPVREQASPVPASKPAPGEAGEEFAPTSAPRRVERPSQPAAEFDLPEGGPTPSAPKVSSVEAPAGEFGPGGGE